MNSRYVENCFRKAKKKLIIYDKQMSTNVSKRLHTDIRWFFHQAVWNAFPCFFSPPALFIFTEVDSMQDALRLTHCRCLVPRFPFSFCNFYALREFFQWFFYSTNNLLGNITGRCQYFLSAKHGCFRFYIHCRIYCFIFLTVMNFLFL